jgi:hypothetical protein
MLVRETVNGSDRSGNIPAFCEGAAERCFCGTLTLPRRSSTGFLQTDSGRLSILSDPAFLDARGMHRLEGTRTPLESVIASAPRSRRKKGSKMPKRAEGR